MNEAWGRRCLGDAEGCVRGMSTVLRTLSQHSHEQHWWRLQQGRNWFLIASEKSANFALLRHISKSPHTICTVHLLFKNLPHLMTYTCLVQVLSVSRDGLSQTSPWPSITLFSGGGGLCGRPCLQFACCNKAVLCNWSEVSCIMTLRMFACANRDDVWWSLILSELVAIFLHIPSYSPMGWKKTTQVLV